MKILRSLFALSFIVVSIWAYIIPSKAQAAVATDTVTVSTDVQGYISITITAGDPVAFGNLTPGTPICNATGSIASVSTNAANGYTLGLNDADATTGSALLHFGGGDATTTITDFTAGSIATPVVWGTPGVNTGLGVGLYAATTTKEGIWGTGTTACDALNKYAAVPGTATTAHTAAGGPKSADTSSWSFKVDVPNTQKTGTYQGNVTFTATTVLS